MGFKRGNSIDVDKSIESILEKNYKKQNNGDVKQTPIRRRKKERETTKSFNFTMRPSVRQKLNELVDYDVDSKADSAASYLSEMIEKRYADLGLNQ